MAIGRGRRTAAVLAAVLVVGSGAPILFSYQHDIGEAWERISARSRLVQTPCGPIEYGVIGDGAPILIVHGAGGDSTRGSISPSHWHGAASA